MKCRNCGATILDGSRKCAYCGETAPVEATAGAVEHSANVFERIRQSPQFQQASGVERLAAIAKPGILMLAIPVVFLAVFVIAALGMAGMAASFAPPIFVIVPVGMAVIGIMMAMAVVQGGVKAAKAPLVPRAAVVRSKRSETSGGSESTSTSYFATFEFPDGSREEFSVTPALYSQLADGDAGVLFTRANMAAAFDRVTAVA
jgi:hypothetical protein